MKAAWYYTLRKNKEGGGFQLRPKSNDDYWLAWVEQCDVVRKRGRSRRAPMQKWFVWLSAGNGEVVNHTAKFKSLRKAKKFAEAAVRLSR